MAGDGSYIPGSGGRGRGCGDYAKRRSDSGSRQETLAGSGVVFREEEYPKDWALRQVVTMEDSLISEMEKRLHAGRARAAIAGGSEEVEPETVIGNSKLVQ